MFNTGIPTKIRSIRYGIKQDGIYYYVRRPYGILYHIEKHQLINAIQEEHQYDRLGVKDRQVVDIGADTGDTAIQFAYRGAKEIYSYEPNITSVKVMDLTLSKNHFSNISLFHKAVMGKEGYVYIDETANPDRGSSLSKGTFRLEAITLDSIVAEHKINNAVLKMDCEGSEYAIIDNASDKTLLAFREMAIELHKGEGNIISRLKKLGYKIETTKPMSNGVYMIFASLGG